MIPSNSAVSASCEEWRQSGGWVGSPEKGVEPSPFRKGQLRLRKYPRGSPPHPPGAALATYTEASRKRIACHRCFASDPFPFGAEKALPTRNREFSACRLA